MPSTFAAKCLSRESLNVLMRLQPAARQIRWTLL
ncbi:hypothetical protein ABIB80_007649 [Bradyrhizobium sp. i1.15.2]